jgi:hypothetical protein
VRLLLRRKNRQEFFFSSSQWGWCLELRQVQDLARPAIIDSCACRPTDVQTHSLNTHRHTHGHPLGHRHSQTHNTRETRLSFSAFFLFSLFFCFPNQLRVIVSGYLHWCLTEGRKNKEALLFSGQEKEQSSSVRVAAVISDNNNRQFSSFLQNCSRRPLADCSHLLSVGSN